MFRYLLIAIGTLSLGIGILGIFLPLVPTTPLLLLSATLYVRSSQRLYDWLLNHRYLGEYIRNFREHRAIPLRAKVVSVALLWGTMLYCIFGLIHILWVQIVLGVLLVGITWHILSYKTLR